MFLLLHRRDRWAVARLWTAYLGAALTSSWRWSASPARRLGGTLTPENAEIVAMHSTVYAQRADVGAIIHTHSPAATAFALANKPLPCRHEPLLRFGQADTIPVAPWGPRGSNVSVHGIAAALDAQPATNAVLLANHGLLVFGADPMATATLVVAIEESAEGEIPAPGTARTAWPVPIGFVSSGPVPTGSAGRRWRAGRSATCTRPVPPYTGSSIERHPA